MDFSSRVDVDEWKNKNYPRMTQPFSYFEEYGHVVLLNKDKGPSA